MNKSLTFSKDYAVFKRDYSAVVREGIYGRTPVSERLISCLWFSRMYIKDLSTADGEPVEVISPGIWNLEEGPDFLRAAIRIGNGEILQGDIEIHIDSRDWRAHQHHKNPLYDNVIAQISLYDDQPRPLATFSGKTLYQITLVNRLTRSLEYIASQVEIERFPYKKDMGLGRCAEAIKSLSSERLIELLTIAGEWRVLEKSGRFAQWSRKENGGLEHTLFRAFMEAMGYYNNRENFVQLADRIPYALLMKQVKLRVTKPNHYNLQSVLLFVSGLMPSKPKKGWDTETARFYQFLKGLWEDFRSAHSFLPLSREKWNMRNRPVNNPMRRIAAASLWVFKNRDKPVILKMEEIFSLMSKSALKFEDKFRTFERQYPFRIEVFFGKDLRKACRKTVERLRNLFRCNSDKYWSYRYTLGGKKLDAPVALIGEKRIDDILINVAIPIMLLSFRETEKESESLLYIIYNSLPAQNDDKITRLMRHRFFGTKTKRIDFENVVVQQGLHQIFKDYCVHDRGGCTDCPFVDNLQRWIEQTGSV